MSRSGSGHVGGAHQGNARSDRAQADRDYSGSRAAERRRSTSRVCARPYCSTAASATMSYSYDSGSVWLDDLTVDGHPMVHDLCSLHADSVSVPKGWRLVDRRSDSLAANDRQSSVTHLAAG